MVPAPCPCGAEQDREKCLYLVQIRGPEKTLESLSLAKKVSIDLKDYTEAGTYTVPVSVELPEDCSLVNDVQVEVVLQEASADQTNQENKNTEEKE